MLIVYILIYIAIGTILIGVAMNILWPTEQDKEDAALLFGMLGTIWPITLCVLLIAGIIWGIYALILLILAKLITSKWIKKTK